ncbi:hypothetical protein OOZ54_13255 [Rhodopseudomonas palustris]|uniref:hypothetical protein n=1 Tax=Rhodopseudomonas palustris TaxID=1076 RepID=UPI0022F01E18|nr:hypothetical protein [Rhodopseudomonas palustris]WBU27631.1 hypothetical protein OOZ54_13255 [Rhodopseudomonas palustris]
MNLRTLKKLSKRAAPLLEQLPFAAGQQFPAPRDDDSYHNTFIGDRKHWDRLPCHPTYEARHDWPGKRGAEIVFMTRAGRRKILRPPTDARKGTIMVGGMSGHSEPEWTEESAWDALYGYVSAHFTEYVPGSDGEDPHLTRRLDNPSDVLRAAREIIDDQLSGHVI